MGRALIRHRRAAQEFSPATCAFVTLLTVGGNVLAERLSGILDFPTGAPRAALASARAIALGGTAFLIGVLLASSTLLALMRAQIRPHADTERTLQKAKTAAAPAKRTKGDFLAVTSHAIRTPLNADMRFANLPAETSLDGAQRGYLGTITPECARLSALINYSPDLSKIEEGRLVLERLPFAPAETTHEVLRLFTPPRRRHEPRTALRGPDRPSLLVAGDPLRFRRMLVHLVDNATTFTPAGSVTVSRHSIPPAPPAASGPSPCACAIPTSGFPEKNAGNSYACLSRTTAPRPAASAAAANSRWSSPPPRRPARRTAGDRTLPRPFLPPAPRAFGSRTPGRPTAFCSKIFCSETASPRISPAAAKKPSGSPTRTATTRSCSTCLARPRRLCRDPAPPRRGTARPTHPHSSRAPPLRPQARAQNAPRLAWTNI